MHPVVPDLVQTHQPSKHGGVGVIRVLIVEDHEMLAEGLELALGASGGIEVAGRVRRVSEIEPAVRRTGVDVVVLDRRLPDGDALSVLPDLVALDTRVLLLTAEADAGTVEAAVSAGAHGVLLKDAGVQRLIEAIHTVAGGGSVLAPELTRRLLERMAGRSRQGPTLTGREAEVLAMLGSGASTEEMAAKLYLSTNTVRNHVQRLLTKLGAHSKVEALAIARREGLLD
jgi:DNA-binding NarL/FixJ family response regulator